MEKSNLKQKILTELDGLIAISCKNPEKSKEYNQLHVALLKKYYNATNVSIDYHRHRIQMEVILDDADYDPNKVNTFIPTIPTNLLFNSLLKFLKSCVEKDRKSLGFYAQLLKNFGKPKNRMELV